MSYQIASQWNFMLFSIDHCKVTMSVRLRQVTRWLYFFLSFRKSPQNCSHAAFTRESLNDDHMRVISRLYSKVTYSLVTMQQSWWLISEVNKWWSFGNNNETKEIYHVVVHHCDCATCDYLWRQVDATWNSFALRYYLLVISGIYIIFV